MAVKTLAVKYRPNTFDDVVEQDAVKIILKQQLESKTIKNAYLFVGGAGTGKTTCARIFANEINNGEGNPIEMDAASNSGVDDVRSIIKEAKSKSLSSEYKVFIIDECHAISNTGWQAFLKLIEEPPAKSIFIFCTTDPQKIPKTILSRVQRYDFQRISQQGIVGRLMDILMAEGYKESKCSQDALEYIAKLAEGGMRDAITLMDKCLSFNTELTIENVVNALGTTDYETMFNLTDALIDMEAKKLIEIVEGIHSQGKDLKQFIHLYMYFLLDIQKYGVGCSFELLQIPKLPAYEEWLYNCDDGVLKYLKIVLKRVIQLNSEIKYSQYPKADVEAVLLMLCLEDTAEEEE